jgi:hypothetical protein
VHIWTGFVVLQFGAIAATHTAAKTMFTASAAPAPGDALSVYSDKDERFLAD